MRAEAWAAVIAGAGIIGSLALTLLVTGYRIGKLESDLRNQTTNALGQIGDRLSRIEAMFELKLKDGPGAGR